MKSPPAKSKMHLGVRNGSPKRDVLTPLRGCRFLGLVDQRIRNRDYG